ncbi:MAG: hypothetical protein AB3N64_04295 [Puniceicoccaceae bacterium]
MNALKYSLLIASLVAIGTQQTSGSYLISTSAREQAGEMRVNGFPFSLSSEEEIENRSIVALPYLLSGGNLVELRLEEVRPVPVDSVPFVSLRIEEEVAESELVKLVDTSRQVDRFEDVDLGTITYTEIFETDFPGKYSQRQSIEIADGASLLELDAVQGTTTYSVSASSEARVQLSINLDAARLTSLPWLQPGGILDSAGQANIRQLITGIHTALVNQDMAGLKTAFQAKNNRLADAFGVTLADIESSQEGFYSQLFSLSGYSVLPLDTNQLRFTSIADVNLVHVTGPDGAPAVTVDSDELTFSLTFYFSEVEGQWVFVE